VCDGTLFFVAPFAFELCRTLVEAWSFAMEPRGYARRTTRINAPPERREGRLLLSLALGVMRSGKPSSSEKEMAGTGVPRRW